MSAQLDLAWRIEQLSVVIYQIRPYGRDATQTIESPVAPDAMNELRVIEKFVGIIG